MDQRNIFSETIQRFIPFLLLLLYYFQSVSTIADYLTQNSWKSESSILNKIKWQRIFQSTKHSVSQILSVNFSAYRLSFIKTRLPLKFTFIEGPFHQRSLLSKVTSIEGCVPSIEGHQPFEVVFHQRLSLIEGHLPSKVIYHQVKSWRSVCQIPASRPVVPFPPRNIMWG